MPPCPLVIALVMLVPWRCFLFVFKGFFSFRKAIASMPPCHCLGHVGALKMFQQKFTISPKNDKNALVPLPFQKPSPVVLLSLYRVVMVGENICNCTPLCNIRLTFTNNPSEQKTTSTLLTIH